MAGRPPDGLHEKVIICYLKQIRCTVRKENSPDKEYWSTAERRRT